MKKVLLSTIALLAFIGFAAQAQDNNAPNNGGGGPSQTDTPRQLDRQDQEFLDKAEPSNLFELRSSKLAIEKASDPRVKEFAQHMLQDHGGESFAPAANTRNVELTPDLQAKFDKMAEMTGADFDQAYMEAQVNAHKEAIGVFTKESELGRDPDLKNLATKSLPMLQQHLDMAEQIKVGSY